MEMQLEQVAQQVSRTGSFDLTCSAEAAFPLFSPEGERQWVKGWNPQPLFPEEIEFRRDTVFRQGEGEEEAVWTIIDADWETHRAEYIRVATASHTAHILVAIESLASQRCLVTVSYTVTAFGADRQHLIDAFSETAYAAKMSKWQRQINECLETRKDD
jgi:hypothetical protein